MAKVLDCDLEVRVQIQLHYYIYFSRGKDMSPLILPAMG